MRKYELRLVERGAGRRLKMRDQRVQEKEESPTTACPRRGTMMSLKLSRSVIAGSL